MRKLWVLVVAAVVIGGVSTVAAAKPPSGTGRQIVERSITVTLAADNDMFFLNEVVTCPQGTASVNGGWAWVNPPDSNQDTFRHVAGGPEEANWRVKTGPSPFFAPFGSTNTFTLWAICVNA
jgi:hypothetical protein